MRFMGDKGSLLRAFERASIALAQREVMPILKDFQVQVGDGHLLVAATNLDLAMLVDVSDVSVEAEGTAIFPGARFLSLLREAPEGTVGVAVDLEELEARVTAGGTEWVLQLTDPEGYPPLPEGEVQAEVDRKIFAGALGRVIYAASVDPARPQLQIVEIKDGMMRASDGVRYHAVEFPLEGDLQIPLGAARALLDLLKNVEVERVGVGQTENHIVFRVAGDVFFASKLALEFPDIYSVLVAPALEGNTFEWRFDRLRAAAGVRQVRVTADEDTNALLIEVGDGQMVLSCRDKAGNYSRTVLEATWNGKGKRLIGVSWSHFLDLLDVVDEPEVTVRLGPDGKDRKSVLLVRRGKDIGVLAQLRVGVPGGN